MGGYDSSIGGTARLEGALKESVRVAKTGGEGESEQKEGERKRKREAKDVRRRRYCVVILQRNSTLSMTLHFFGGDRFGHLRTPHTHSLSLTKEVQGRFLRSHKPKRKAPQTCSLRKSRREEDDTFWP